MSEKTGSCGMTELSSQVIDGFEGGEPGRIQGGFHGVTNAVFHAVE
ncbi:hypothetical protein NWF34_10280 [Gordonia sp. GONU]|nr:hypothetical protein [Gordonia sp. GONU]MCR8897335.1 hypothetical protein [Gordonia sp. GONU]